ncbi:MAG: BrnA antitoxin family protein [Spirochaetota bacterium]
MKTAEQQYKERSEIFAPDGYEIVDAPEEVTESMEAARNTDSSLVDCIPAPSELVRRKPKRAMTLRIDEDTLEWFQSMGKGYQTKINAILASYKAAHDSRKV